MSLRTLSENLLTFSGPQRPPRLRRREGRPRDLDPREALLDGRQPGSLLVRGRHARGPQRHSP